MTSKHPHAQKYPNWHKFVQTSFVAKTASITHHIKHQDKAYTRNSLHRQNETTRATLLNKWKWKNRESRKTHTLHLVFLLLLKYCRNTRTPVRVKPHYSLTHNDVVALPLVVTVFSACKCSFRARWLWWMRTTDNATETSTARLDRRRQTDAIGWMLFRRAKEDFNGPHSARFSRFSPQAFMW